jgi:hypothetical protein
MVIAFFLVEINNFQSLQLWRGLGSTACMAV